MSFLQAIVIALVQGVTELFPVSSLGHSVLVPAWIGHSWTHLVAQSSTQSSETSPYLNFIVALHVATAIALLWYFRKDWVRIIRGLWNVVRTRRVSTSSERLALLLVIGTIPVGITGLALEHTFRTVFAKPLPAAIFLTVNGAILLAGERLRRRDATHRSLESLDYREAGAIGLFQTLALLAGISRAGITLVGGLVRGLDHEDASRFAFLLATPVIFAAGFLKLPGLFGDGGKGIGGQVIVGAIIAAVASYVSVRFLVRYFEKRTLTVFAVYCLAAGAVSIIRFA